MMLPIGVNQLEMSMGIVSLRIDGNSLITKFREIGLNHPSCKPKYQMPTINEIMRAIIVAQAAPSMPQAKYSIKIGSRIILIMVAMSEIHIEALAMAAARKPEAKIMVNTARGDASNVR